MSEARPPVNGDYLDASAANAVANNADSLLHVSQAIPNSSTNNEGVEGASMAGHLTSILESADDEPPPVPFCLHAGIEPLLATLEGADDSGPPIPASQPSHEFEDGPKSGKNVGFKTLDGLDDEGPPLPNIVFADGTVSPKLSGAKAGKGLKSDHWSLSQ